VNDITIDAHYNQCNDKSMASYAADGLFLKICLMEIMNETSNEYP